MEDMMTASLQPIEDKEVVDAVATVVENCHEDLQGANLALFWELDKPVSQWGAVKVATEETWLLSGIDIILRMNNALWDELSIKARHGLIDHFLSCVEAKEGGKTHMRSAKGVRRLYSRNTPSLSIHPHVLARCPELLDELEELRQLHRAVSDPDQFLIDFEAGDDEDEEPEEEIAA